MTLPSWRNPSFGSMIRAALWLETEVGVGNAFRKTALREAFPDVAQIDRRVRDLRKHGWRIDTHREDPTLKQEEQRYVKKGAEVWIPGQAKGEPNSSLTAARRSKVLAEDSFLCRSCGVAAGDLYDDGVLSAQLDVARRKVQLPDGILDVQLVTECNRCRVGGRGTMIDLAEVISRVKSLSLLEQEIFASWVKEDRRKFSELDSLWGIYRALPAVSRDAVKQALGSGDTK
ncbi:hypothetical protein [Saccharopolyspora phatthalungensis]|uniref:HNH endonuclease n=1 Tax=Saccharopolyspora phatthalungensis TaxID=664693 RepID=A0A840Q4R8_9PSEU|nr:hypothetical protein [Saccharopolyspora phatthalungensis]MBB5153728.1 hypothetical protein [Saccharopolyspora phatthalungensis]